MEKSLPLNTLIPRLIYTYLYNTAYVYSYAICFAIYLTDLSQLMDYYLVMIERYYILDKQGNVQVRLLPFRRRVS